MEGHDVEAEIEAAQEELTNRYTSASGSDVCPGRAKERQAAGGADGQAETTGGNGKPPDKENVVDACISKR